MNEKYLVITVDTESDWFNMRENKVTSIEGLHFLQEVCAKYDMVPTYLVTYEMATKHETIKVIKGYLDSALCEVGHHLHIWSTPPFENCNSYGVDEKWIEGLQSEIPDDIFEKKMKSLHDAIKNNFDVTPTSHRAGRWAIDKRTLIWLEKNNYLVDTSVCPHVLWTFIKGVNDYIKTDTYLAPDTPYYPYVEDITRKAAKKESAINVLEVPLTSVRGNILTKFKFRGKGKLRSILYKVGYYGLGNLAFRPSFKEPLNIFQKMTQTILRSDVPVINFMLHSSELTLGTSPYTKNKENLEMVKKKIEFALKAAKEYGVKGLALSKTADYFTNSFISKDSI